MMLFSCLTPKEVLLPASPLNFTQPLTSKAVEQEKHLTDDCSQSNTLYCFVLYLESCLPLHEFDFYITKNFSFRAMNGINHYAKARKPLIS